MYVKQRFKPLCKVLESSELNEAISIQGMSERYILQTRFEIYVLKYMLRSRFYNRDDTTGLSWNCLMLPLFHKFNNFQQPNLAFTLLIFKMRSQFLIT